MTGIEEVALYAALASAAVGAVATVYSAQQQADAQDYQADVADKNAMVARSQASAREEAQRQHARQIIGKQLAATAESGGGLTGSNLDLLGSSLYSAELDSLNIRYEGELKASGLTDQAGLLRSEASDTRAGGYLSATGKLIGASSTYLNAYGTVPSYSYNNDAAGTLYSGTGAAVRARR